MSAIRSRISKIVSSACRSSPSPTSPPVTPKINGVKPERIRRTNSDFRPNEVQSPVSTPRKNLCRQLLVKIGSPVLIAHLGTALLSPTATTCLNEDEDVLGTLDVSDNVRCERPRRRYRFSEVTDSGTESMRSFSDSQDGASNFGPSSRSSSVHSSVSTLDEEDRPENGVSTAEEVGQVENEPSLDVEMDTPTRNLVLVNGLEALSTKPTVVGKGGFGTVITAQHKGKRVAVKVISKQKRRRRSVEYSLRGERNALTLDHGNIVKTLGIFGLNEDYALVIMEYAGLRNLLQIINDVTETIPLSRRLGFSFQLANALKFCHENNIAHLDVKPANVIVGPNDECKLADFGCSQEINVVRESYKSTSPLDGTVAYKAPELLRGNNPTTKADVYSYGITLWQMLLREQPFSNMDPHVIVYKVVSSNARPTPAAAEDGCNYEYVRLFQQCWEGNTDYRLTIDEALHCLKGIANTL